MDDNGYQELFGILARRDSSKDNVEIPNADIIDIEDAVVAQVKEEVMQDIMTVPKKLFKEILNELEIQQPHVKPVRRIKFNSLIAMARLALGEKR